MSDYSHVNSHGELIEDGSWRNTLIGRSEIIFTLIFTIECCLKIIGMGFYGSKGYLKDRWNWLDFIVVITGYALPFRLFSRLLMLFIDGYHLFLEFLMFQSYEPSVFSAR